MASFLFQVPFGICSTYVALYLFAEEVPCGSASFHNLKIFTMGKSILFTGVRLCFYSFSFFWGCLTHLDIISRALDDIFPPPTCSKSFCRFAVYSLNRRRSGN